MKKDQETSLEKIFLWPFRTPSRSFEEIKVRIVAILIALLCLILVFGSINEQVVRYFVEAATMGN